MLNAKKMVMLSVDKMVMFLKNAFFSTKISSFFEKKIKYQCGIERTEKGNFSQKRIFNKVGGRKISWW